MPETHETPKDKTFLLQEAHIRVKQLEELQSHIQAKIDKIKGWLSNQPTLPGMSAETSRLKVERIAEEYTAEFEEIWKMYPERNGMKREKRKAFRRFMKTKAADFMSIRKAVFNYSRSVDAKTGYARDMVRFLNDDFWPAWVTPTTAMMKPREGGRRPYEQEQQQKADTSSADEIVASLKREQKRR